MPCRDYYDDNTGAYYAKETKWLKVQVSFAESALCATLDALEYVMLSHDSVDVVGPIYDYIDCEEAGIDRDELIKWHTKHKELDTKHRAEEAAKLKKELELEQLRAEGLAKLTKAQRKALGL